MRTMADYDTSELGSDATGAEESVDFAPADFGTRAELLPLLPLTPGVVLPQMVVTIALETDEAKRAGAAAAVAGDRIVLVPRVDGKFAGVGTIAAIESAGDLPNGTRALVIRGVSRGRVGTGELGAHGALHVQVDAIDETAAPTPRALELARE